LIETIEYPSHKYSVPTLGINIERSLIAKKRANEDIGKFVWNRMRQRKKDKNNNNVLTQKLASWFADAFIRSQRL
jgi:hypothetical protein